MVVERLQERHLHRFRVDQPLPGADGRARRDRHQNDCVSKGTQPIPSKKKQRNTQYDRFDLGQNPETITVQVRRICFLTTSGESILPARGGLGNAPSVQRWPKKDALHARRDSRDNLGRHNHHNKRSGRDLDSIKNPTA